jgi:Flp pilus assembly CpaF family ATPase
VGAHGLRKEAISRGPRMLRTALGPAIARWLEDPGVAEVMLNPDGRLWIDRLAEGLNETGEHLSAADGERIVPITSGSNCRLQPRNPYNLSRRWFAEPHP